MRVYTWVVGLHGMQPGICARAVGLQTTQPFIRNGTGYRAEVNCSAWLHYAGVTLLAALRRLGLVNRQDKP